MPTLHFQLFGNHCVVRQGSEAGEIHLLPAARSLLAYLLINREQRHSRDVLAEVFWQHDAERARKCLRTTLWRLRSELEGEADGGAYLLVSPQGEIAFNTASDHWLDVAAFEEGVARGLARLGPEMAAADAAALEAACACYRGDLLQSVYDDWAIRERERLRLLYLRALTGLLCYYRRVGDYEQGLACGERILAMDPLREKVHREMMRLHARQGQRVLAVRQYEWCRTVLEEELGIGPMPETEAVFQQITGEANGNRNQGGRRERPVSLQQAVQQVAASMQAVEQTQAQLEQARVQLKQAMQMLRRLVERGADEGQRPK
jgi:DNA-binding SARP family transcriptional activator